MIQPFLSRQFLTFLLTGGTAAIVNFCSRILYSFVLDFSSAVIFAYITGMVTAFFLARMFVFKNGQQALHTSAAIFILVNLLAILQTWGISMGMAFYFLPWIGVSSFVPEIAHATGVIAPVFSSYLGHKRWSFR